MTVANLPSALPPGAKGFPEKGGQFLLPLVGDATGYRVAGLPRSPGYEPADATTRPPVYPWTDDTRAQLKGLGILP